MTIEGLGHFITSSGSVNGSLLNAVHDCLNNPKVKKVVGGALRFAFTTAMVGATGYFFYRLIKQTPPPPPCHPVRYHDPVLNAQLHRAVKEGTMRQCLSLLAQKADPNAPDSEGRTPYQLAKSENRMGTCKALIDHGANWTREDWFDLGKQLVNLSIDERRLYITPFPHFDEPELFIQGDFQNLSSLNSEAKKSQRLPLALFFVADENVTSSCYGFISNTFVRSYHSQFAVIAQHYTLTRVRVNSKDKLVPLMDWIQKEFPELILALVVLHAHANSEYMRLAMDCTLGRSLSDDGIFKEMGNRVVPFGVFVLFGCCTANGDLAMRVSLQTTQQKVYGTYNLVNTMIPNIRYDSSRQPNFQPSFRSSSGARTIGYQNGEVIYVDPPEVSPTTNPFSSLD